MLPRLQPVEISRSVKRSRYLFSDIASLRDESLQVVHQAIPARFSAPKVKFQFKPFPLKHSRLLGLLLIPLLWKGPALQPKDNYSLDSQPAKRALSLTAQSSPEAGPNPREQSLQNLLPLEWLLQPRKAASLADARLPLNEAQTDVIVDRILARLVQAEAHEPHVWLRDDYRQSFITIALAAKGSALPFVEASYRMYGPHPDKLWPAIVARRKAQLGAEYSNFYDANDNRIIEPVENSPFLLPKKSAQSIRPESSEVKGKLS